MKHLILVLALALVSCKKDDPEPEPPKPVEQTQADAEFIADSRYTYDLYINWDQDAGQDTIIHEKNGKTSFKQTIKQKTIKLTGFMGGRPYGDTTKLKILIRVPGKADQVLSDTTYKDREINLW